MKKTDLEKLTKAQLQETGQGLEPSIELDPDSKRDEMLEALENHMGEHELFDKPIIDQLADLVDKADGDEADEVIIEKLREILPAIEHTVDPETKPPPAPVPTVNVAEELKEVLAMAYPQSGPGASYLSNAEKRFRQQVADRLWKIVNELEAGA